MNLDRWMALAPMGPRHRRFTGQCPRGPRIGQRRGRRTQQEVEGGGEVGGGGGVTPPAHDNARRRPTDPLLHVDPPLALMLGGGMV